MPQKRFDEKDRRQVIEETEKALGIKLNRIGKYRKYFKGNDGKNYCILGGFGDWHGLQSELLNPMDSTETDRILIVARVLRNSVELYSSSMKALITNKNKLTYAKQSTGSEYQFDLIYRHSDEAFIKQFPEYRLKKFHEFKYSRVVNELMSEISTMSKDEIRHLVDHLQKPSQG